MTATLLKSQEILIVSSNDTTVNGDAGSGIEVVIIGQGVTGAILDVAVERVALNGSSSDFKYQNESNSLVIYSGSSTVVTIPIQADSNGTQVTFTNGTVNVFSGQSGMTFGAVPVVAGSGSSTATSITPITIDPYFVTSTGVPPTPPPPADNPVTGNLNISGNSSVGSIISVTSNTLDDPDGIGSIMYTWYSSPQSTGGTATTLQATATADPYTIQNSDNGNYIWLGIHIVDVNSNVTDLYTSPRVGPVTGGSGGGSDVTPPVFQNAGVQANGMSLILIYDEDLHATTASVNDFIVTVAGTPVTISSVAAQNPAMIRLYLQNAVLVGQAVTVSYTQPSGDNAIKDLAGNKAASIPTTNAGNASTVTGGGGGSDTSGPFIQSAVVSPDLANTDGLTLGIVYDEPLKDGVLTTSNFYVSADGEVNTVISAIVPYGASYVRLGLDWAIQYGQTVSVGYNAIGGELIKDLAGNSAVGFTTGAYNNSTVVDTTAPVLQSAVVDPSGLLKLNYNEVLRTNTAAISSFTVMVDGGQRQIASVSSGGGGKTVTLTFQYAINTGAIVTVSYNAPPPGNYGIQDIAGNRAVSLSTYAVTNNSTV